MGAQVINTVLGVWLMPATEEAGLPSGSLIRCIKEKLVSRQVSIQTDFTTPNYFSKSNNHEELIYFIAVDLCDYGWYTSARN
jgi:hypothetical protein